VTLLRTVVERAGFACLLLGNTSVLLWMAAFNLLSEGSLVVVHLVNVMLLATLECVHPIQRDWLPFDDDGVRWRLLGKTYGWYLFDSRVWFALHSALMLSAAKSMLPLVDTHLVDVGAWPALLQWCVLALLVDGVRYAIHRASHAIPLLWRFHAMHHTPSHMTPARAWWTHPVDDVLLYSAEIFIMVWLGFSHEVVLVYVCLDNLFQLMNHANVRMRPGLLGMVWQHPRCHLLHHRIAGKVVNFGEMFTVWDRLFGTFEAGDLDDMAQLRIGILPHKRRTLWHQLTAPFSSSGKL